MSREHAGRLSFASEVKALFAGDPALPRRLDPRGLDQVFTFWTPVAPQTVFEGIEEVEPGTVRVYSDTSLRQHRAYDPGFPDDAAGRVPRHARRCRGRSARGPRQRHQPADAPRRRAGRQLSVRRTRQLAHRRAGPAGEGRELRHLLAEIRGRGVRRDRISAADGRASRQRPSRGARRSRRHRARVPRRDPPHRAARIAHRAGAAVSAVEAGARRRNQGGAHRRGRRRDVRRLRSVSRGEDTSLLGRASRPPSAGRACSSASIPTWSDRRSHSGPSRDSSSAAASTASARLASDTSRAGLERAR